MKITELENGWTQIEYDKKDFFDFTHNGWNCRIMPSSPSIEWEDEGNIWEFYTWPYGTEGNYGNDSFGPGPRKLKTFTEALKECVYYCFQRPDDDRELHCSEYGYDDDELNEIVIQLLLTRIKNGHKKYNRKKPVRPISIQSAWSKLVKHRDGNKCINCGSDQNLQAHHIKHYKDDNNNWDVSNGITLCFQCHQTEHHG